MKEYLQENPSMQPLHGNLPNLTGQASVTLE